MSHYQQLILNWVTQQSGYAGLVLFAAGLVTGFHGFRCSRVLYPLLCAGAGWVLGGWVATMTAAPPELAPWVGAALLGFPAAARAGFGSVAGGAVTVGTLGAYLLGQLGVRGLPVFIAGAICGAIGATLSAVCRRGMAVLVTSLLGGGLMIVGFVGVASTVVPTFSSTFRSFASGWPITVPIVLTMLTVMCYSYQANQRQGALAVGSVTGSERISV